MKALLPLTGVTLAFIAGCMSAPVPVALPQDHGYRAVENDGWRSILRVGNARDPFVGTCWAFAPGLFATAAHVPADETALTIEGHAAELIYFDGPTDVAVLRCPGLADAPPLDLNFAPQVGIRARARGYTNGGGRPVQTTGTVSCAWNTVAATERRSGWAKDWPVYWVAGSSPGVPQSHASAARIRALPMRCTRAMAMPNSASPIITSTVPE